MRVAAKLLVTVFLFGATSTAAFAQGDPVIEECSECIPCVGNPELTSFKEVLRVLDPGEEDPGYVMGWLSSWNCQDSYSCDGDLITCRGAIEQPAAEDMPLVAAALGVSPGEAMAYLQRTRFSVRRVPERNAVQLISCGGTIVAHLPVPQGRIAD